MDSTLGITKTCKKHAAMLTDAKNLPTNTALSESKGMPGNQNIKYIRVRILSGKARAFINQKYSSETNVRSKSN